MPELPEVETVMRGLAPVLAGARLVRVEQRRPDLRWPLPERFGARLEGRRVSGLSRRSKVMLIALDDAGAGAETWLVHLGMSGRMLVGEAAPVCPPDGTDGAGGSGDPRLLGAFLHGGAAASPHDHVVVETDRGARIVYNDARRFGAMDLWPSATLGAHPWLARLGPEPLGEAFTGHALAARLAGRMTPIKAALLDQRVVAGLGNIYVSEALHRAGIHPRRIAGTISAARIERLADALRETLAEAIAAGGSSLRDHRRTDGELGYFQHAFRVYSREGEPCPRAGCPGRVRRIVQSGRSSFYCARCQR